MSKNTFGGLFWSPARLRQTARSACICETCLLCGVFGVNNKTLRADTNNPEYSNTEG